MANKKNHLKKEERFFIEKMLKINKSFNQIAKLLERGLSTISEEVNRNGGRDSYSSNSAQFQANKRQSSKKVSSNKVTKNTKLKRIVDKHLSEGYSPEAISKIIKSKKNSRVYVSPKSIRKYIKLKYKP